MPQGSIARSARGNRGVRSFRPVTAARYRLTVTSGSTPWTTATSRWLRSSTCCCISPPASPSHRRCSLRRLLSWRFSRTFCSRFNFANVVLFLPAKGGPPGRAGRTRRCLARLRRAERGSPAGKRATSPKRIAASTANAAPANRPQTPRRRPSNPRYAKGHLRLLAGHALAGRHSATRSPRYSLLARGL